MTEAEFHVGDAVAVKVRTSSWDRTDRWEADIVKRITAASVITEAHGAFRLSSNGWQGSLRRNGAGGCQVVLRRADDPQVKSAEDRRAAQVRQQGRDVATRSDAVYRWVQQGTTETLAALLAVLTEAQALHGEADQ